MPISFIVPWEFDGGLVKSLSDPINLTLTGFRNASLEGLVLWVERVGQNQNQFRTQAQANAYPADGGLNTIPMSNIILNYAGNQVYTSNSTELSQALDNMVNMNDSTYNYGPVTRSNVITGATAVVNSAYRAPFLRVQVAQWSEQLTGYMMVIQAAGGLFSNDTLQLQFQIYDNFSGATGLTNPPTNINYLLHVEHLYTSSVCIERGSANFKFVNPAGQPQITFTQ